MLNGQLYALKDLLSAAQRELDHLPPFIEYADLHNHLSDFTDDLDSVVTDLYFLIKTMEISLSTTIDQSPTKEVFLRPWQPASEPAGQQEQTKPLNFFQKLILGIGAERAFLAEERYYQERKQERERRWDDPSIGRTPPVGMIPSAMAWMISMSELFTSVFHIVPKESCH